MENIPQPTYEIFVRNRNFEIETVINNYSSLEFRQVYNGVGGWILEMQSTTQAAIIMKRLFLAIGQNEIPSVGGYVGIIVTRDGKIVFSGIIQGFEQTGEYMGEEDQENITFFGLCDNALLSMRILMVPLINSNPQEFISPSNQNWGVWRYPSRDENPRVVSSVLYTMMADNISFNAPNDRNIRFLYIKKPLTIGPVTVVRGRYQNLLQKCQEISYFLGDPEFQAAVPSYRGIQFRTMQLDKPRYVISAPLDSPNLNMPVAKGTPNSQEKRVMTDIFYPRDKRNTVVFSKGFKNLGSFRYKFTAPQTTHVVLGGQNNPSSLSNPNHTPNPISLGDGDPRTRWLAHSAADSGRLNNLVARFGLWESFLDKRDITYGQPDPANPLDNSDPYPLIEPRYTSPPLPPLTPGQIQYNTRARAAYDEMIAEFTQAMQTEMVEKRELLEVEIEAINIKPTIWSVDYQVGDVVTVVIPEEERGPFAAKVKEVTVTLTQDRGEVVKAVIGTETQPNGRDIFSKIIRVNNKANFLEELR